MAEQFYTILTDIGKAKIANASALGTVVNFSELALGDSNGSYYNPTEDQSNLVNEVWRGQINNIKIDADNSNWIVLETIIPTDQGGFMVREVGIFDSEGNMLAVGKYPETYKPIASEGSSKDLRVRIILEVSNTDVVNLSIDPSVIFATKDDIDAVNNNVSDLAGEGRSNETVKQNADNINSLEGVGRTTETVKQNADDITSLQTQTAELEKVNLQQSLEILDLKMQLEQNNLIDFINNKTGVGYYDMFSDTTGIDETRTSANVDVEVKKVMFNTPQVYDITVKEDATSSTEIVTEQSAVIGDRIDDTNEILNVVDFSTSETHEVVDATVTPNAYTTSASARPQILDNGWVISAVKDSGYVRFYALKPPYTSYEVLCTIGVSSATLNFAVESKGNIIYLIVQTTNTSMAQYAFDASIVPNKTLIGSDIGVLNWGILDGSQDSFSVGCSLTINPQGTELHACWSSKNSTLLNSFNIRYAKGTINPDGSVTWGGVEQVTILNTSGNDFGEPSIGFDGVNPFIIFKQSGSVNRIIIASQSVNTATLSIVNWNNTPVYEGSSYTQSSPSAIFVPQEINGLPNGRIWVAWHGKDNIEAINHCRLSYSDDSGVTWSAMEKLTSGEGINSLQFPSITANKNNEIFILGRGYDSNLDTYIAELSFKDGTWSPPSIKVSAESKFPSTLFDGANLDFTEPLFVYQDVTNSKVGFYGVWTTGVTEYNLTLQNAITVNKNDILSVFPAQHPYEILTMKPQEFNQFSSIDLRLYPTKMNYATISGDVSSSTAVTTGATDKELHKGDNLWIDNQENEIIDLSGNYVTHEVTDATVTANAYDTSGNGGRKLIQLDNGWLVCSVYAGGLDNYRTYFYVYKPEETNPQWQQLCYIQNTTTATANGVAILETNGSRIFAVTRNGNTGVYFYNFDPITQSDINIFNTAISIDSGQSQVGNELSLIINPSRTEIHGAWQTKNSTYPNSFNIRYTKGIINLDGSVAWGSVEQVTTYDHSAYGYESPSIIIRGDGLPSIVMMHVNVASNWIAISNFDGTTWGTHNEGNSSVIYNGDSYPQSSPSAIFVPQEINGLPNGRIWVAWHGKDSTDASKTNIRISYSDDGGSTWSAMEKLTSGDLNAQMSPSITCNKDGVVYVCWYAYDSANTCYYIRSIKYDGAWGEIIDVTDLSANRRYVSTLFDSTFTFDFIKPLFIYQDATNSRVGFYGTWQVGEGYNLTMQTPVTLTDGQKVSIVDFYVNQGDVSMTLDNIDDDKYEFSVDNLNTNITDIKVKGSQSELDDMVYVVE